MRKERIKKKKPIKPCGTIIPIKDYFKLKSKNIGVFKKPKIERNNNTDELIKLSNFHFT